MKEFASFRTHLHEDVEDLSESQTPMPPAVLILRRKSVRQYPGGLMVALYFNDKLNQYFSIPYGDPEVDSAITPTTVKEDHQVGDVVHYRSGGSEHLKKGKVVEIGQGHVKIHRKEPHGGKYGYHYKVPHDAIVHNERMGESVKLNEISIPKASQAYHARQQQGLDAMNKGHYGAALPHFKKALDTMRHRSKKYEREDKGETVKESVIAEDAISHLQRVRSFKTSQPLNHKDGTKTKVDPTTANALLTVHAALHPDNKQKFADSLEHSQGKFNRMCDFSWKQVHE